MQQVQSLVQEAVASEVKLERISIQPRPDWQKRLEDAGCYYHTIDEQPYWRDDAVYKFHAAEIDKIEAAGNEVHQMCMDLVEETIDRGDYVGYDFPDEVKQIIAQSWNEDQCCLYGRFDFGCVAGKELKLFEYNADTPTSLPEASVWQWQALEDRHWPDQFNSIHELLLAQFNSIVEPGRRIYFTGMKDGPHEDWGNVHYLLETAVEAGFDATSIDMDQIGWNGKEFTDLHEKTIQTLFKLYPWEWMMGDEFGWKVRASNTQFIEPAWKMLLSTKALLPLLWKNYPGHPLLLESYLEKDFGNIYQRKGDWVRKPMLGREGANITSVRDDGKTYPMEELDPEYDKHGYVLQKKFIVDAHGIIGKEIIYPVLGVWIIGDEACGLGVREDSSYITTNNSCFVPHCFE